MLKKLGKITSRENKATLPSSCRIAGEFYVENSHFLVISTDSLTQASATLTSAQELVDPSFAVLGHFDHGNNCYLIVNAENIAEDLESGITSLLTERELQIAALIAVGWSNKQVAHQLGISEWTVSAHLRRIFIKLNVDSRAAMVYRCSSLIHRMHQLHAVPQLDSDVT
jgi:DNA-binding CsgD family transcriptional regulator